MPSISSANMDENYAKFKEDGFIYPLQVFEDNLFNEKGYFKKYKEFRQSCENQLISPLIHNNPRNTKIISKSSIIVRS